MDRRKTAMTKARELAESRSEATQLATQEWERLRDATAKQEQEWLERKFECDRLRMSRIVSGAEDRERERQEVERVRHEYEVALAIEVDKRQKAQDVTAKKIEQNRRRVAQQAAEAKEKSKKAREEMQNALAAARASDQMTKLQQVLDKTHEVEKLYEREFEVRSALR